MSEIEVHRRYCNCFGKTHTGLSNKQNKPIHIQTAVQVQACKQLLKLITAEILLLFIVGRLALDDNLETTAIQAKQIEEMKPKATYCDMVLQSAGLMPITTIAKDYGKSAKWLNKWLHEHGIQYKLGKVWLLYQKYADRGYVKSKTFTVLDENGDSIAKPNTQWTQRGRMFIYEQLKKEGILPLIEQDDS